MEHPSSIVDATLSAALGSVPANTYKLFVITRMRPFSALTLLVG